MQFTQPWFCQLRLAFLLGVLSKHHPIHHFQTWYTKWFHGSAWFGRGATYFQILHPSKIWVTEGFTSKGDCSSIPSHQTHYSEWNLATLTFVAFWRFFWSSFCSSKSFCNSHRTVRQRHGEGAWIPSLSCQLCNKLFMAEPPSRKWNHHPTASSPMQISRQRACKDELCLPIPLLTGVSQLVIINELSL